MNKTISFTTKEQSFPANTPTIAFYNVWVNDAAKTAVQVGGTVTLDLLDGIYIAHVQAVDVNGTNVGTQVDSDSFTIVTPQPVIFSVPDVVTVA